MDGGSSISRMSRPVAGDKPLRIKDLKSPLPDMTRQGVFCLISTKKSIQPEKPASLVQLNTISNVTTIQLIEELLMYTKTAIVLVYVIGFVLLLSSTGCHVDFGPTL